MMPHEPIDWAAELLGTLIWLQMVALFMVFWMIAEWEQG